MNTDSEVVLINFRKYLCELEQYYANQENIQGIVGSKEERESDYRMMQFCQHLVSHLDGEVDSASDPYK